MEEIKRDLKEIKHDVQEIRVLQGQHNVLLDAHMKRTDLNEARIAKLEYWLLGSIFALALGLLSKII